jgi:hypothetical protein
MAATSRRNGTAPAPDLAELADRIEQLEKIQTITLKIVARLAVQVAPGRETAPLSRIIANELRAATLDEATAVETWLTAHQGEKGGAT